MTILLRTLVFMVVLLAVLGQFLKTLATLAGVSNVVPTVRDLSLIVIAFVGLIAGNVVKSQRLLVGTCMVVLSLFIYLLIAFVEDNAIAGLYFARTYILPLFFAVALHGALRQQTIAEIRKTIQFALGMSLIIVVSALVLYLVTLIYPTLGATLISTGEIQSAWYISGGTWLRMGLPATGPNSLGLILGLNILLILSLLDSGQQTHNKWILALLGLSVIGLILTFSRSSWLMVMAGTLLLYVSRSKLEAIKGIALFLLVAAILAGVTLAILAATDATAFDQISLWLELNLSGRDPSMQGHLVSFQDAWEQLDQYYLHGFPKGTVGPKALSFTNKIHNAESSPLALVYDMGLPLSILFMAGWALILTEFYITRAQWAVLFGFIVCTQFLPYIFEADSQIYFLFIYVLVGLGAKTDASVSLTGRSQYA